MILVGIGLAILMLRIDAGFGAEDQIEAHWFKAGDGEDARNLLSTLLTATITMASMAFSVTMVVLTLAANAYGSRLIRTFRADLRTQGVLGTFALAIVYCLIVLRSVEGKAPAADVPHASVTLGTLLAFGCVLALVAFIHGVARSIVAEDVVRRVRKDVHHATNALPKLPSNSEAPRWSAAPLPVGFEEGAQHVPLPYEGYVQAVDFEAVLKWAEESDRYVKFDFQPGDFIVDGDKRVLVYPCTDDVEATQRTLGRFIVSGDERTPTQDLEFGLRHLVEIALRALSPSTNDPFTAMAVIDRLQSALSQLAGRSLPPATVADREGEIRLWRKVSTFGDLSDVAFNQIRQAGSDRPAVLIRLLHAITGIAAHTTLDKQRDELLRHARMIVTAAEREVPEQGDVEDVQNGFQAASKALRAAGSQSATRSF
jgi:uncharacterized membrane protein